MARRRIACCEVDLGTVLWIVAREPRAVERPGGAYGGIMARTTRDGLVAVTGAGGRLGSRLAFRLAAEGARQRLIVTDRRRTPHLTDGRPLPETEVAVCPPDDFAALEAAFVGADSVFLVGGRNSEAAVAAAKRARVRRVVLVSQAGAHRHAIATAARDLWHAEQRLKASGLAWTILRTSVFHSYLPEAVHNDVLRAPCADGRVASVAHDDVADVATAVLLDERARVHDRATYLLTGPEALSLAEAAEVIGRTAGRAVTYEPQTVQQAYLTWGRRARADLEAWVTCCAAIAAGVYEEIGDTVERLASRPARSLAAWLDDYPAEWALR